jgi:cytoskeleton protein RodZ
VQPAANEQDPVVADRAFTIPQQGAVRVLLPRDEDDQDDQDDRNHQDDPDDQDGTVAALEDDAPESLQEPTAAQARATSPGRWARLFGIGRDAASATTDAPADETADETAAAVVVPEQPSPGRAADEEPEPDPDFEPVQPARQPQPASRSEVVRDSVRMLPHPPSIPVQRNAETPVVVARVDDFVVSEPRPASDAVIGPLIAAARHRARLSIDTLSERTRIRPHVLECIEVDDFDACGGDFYARGHLRTLARIFGLDAQQLLDLYDDRYARAEIQARQVFEAELATGIGGGVRATYTGPRWSLLAACVLALAGVWGVARVFNDTPQELVSPAPNVVDSAGLANSEPEQAPKLTLATLEVAAAGTSPQVVIRDRDGRILWAGKLGDGQHQQVIGLAPFDVTASNGAAVKVSYLGRSKGTVGPSAAAHSKSFG